MAHVVQKILIAHPETKLHLLINFFVSQVADYLSLRRDVLFLEFDTSMRHTLRDTLLSTGNVPGFRNITDSIYTALTNLGSVQRSSLFNAYMNVPEPLQARDAKALELYPWRAYLGR